MTATQLLILGKKFKTIADAVYALSALFVVPCVVVTPVLWCLQKPPEIRSHVQARTVLGGSMQELQGGIEFNEGQPLRVAYHLELIDRHGRIIKFPKVETRGTPRFDNMLIPIPATIKPGDYQLVAKVQYTVNPIKAVAKEIPVTTITVN
jgi:hypothetical protein